jgi:CubicO group peptidase (beta-lactamase class C family)
MVKWLDDWKQSNIHAVLVVRHGTLVFEHYFSGADEHWGRSVGEVAFGPEIKHDERSVTKSIVALVLGIAIDRGLIKSLDEPVLSFFPDYADLRTPEKDRITLRDLVTMSGGLEWHEDDTPYTSEANSENRMDNAADPYRYALQQSVVAPSGQLWNYNSGSTEVIGAVLKKATGKSVDELAGTLLFAPLGITDVEWPRNARGDPIAAGALRLRPRDLAKIGQLVLQHGAWNGTQVVPASWIEAATSAQINVSGFTSFFYGYFFWPEIRRPSVSPTGFSPTRCNMAATRTRRVNSLNGCWRPIWLRTISSTPHSFTTTSAFWRARCWRERSGCRAIWPQPIGKHNRALARRERVINCRCSIRSAGSCFRSVY